MARSNGTCPCCLCHLERNLLACLAYETSQGLCRKHGPLSPAFDGLSDVQELIDYLHGTQYSRTEQSRVDAILVELLRMRAVAGHEESLNAILLAIFMPAAHRIFSHICISSVVPSPEDVAQEILMALLSIFSGSDLRNRRSHVAYNVVLLLKRKMYGSPQRRAPHSPVDWETPSDTEISEIAATDTFLESKITLDQLLRRAVIEGKLTREERELLTRFKIERSSGAELGEIEGITADVARKKINRLIKRLKRAARSNEQAQLRFSLVFDSHYSSAGAGPTEEKSIRSAFHAKQEEHPSS